eukprot:CAMPEP_0204521818 /NCGR_PEP_ID=MMETSP0661-20131031/5986_1 /ASSEMBLY_ACC=CAM_ASM_000606 /TAXON_ID=109239 /ORGANISM="Alexandrium margalefi, Strain AMGDE01CS-322" /LENGTH=149 /DNA_ID=CAMNT_0051527439 /DNA_START=70 /DNA_END=516 /DNA_ORIENTATION=+
MTQSSGTALLQPWCKNKRRGLRTTDAWSLGTIETKVTEVKRGLEVLRGARLSSSCRPAVVQLSSSRVRPPDAAAPAPRGSSAFKRDTCCEDPAGGGVTAPGGRRRSQATTRPSLFVVANTGSRGQDKGERAQISTSAASLAARAVCDCP